MADDVFNGPGEIRSVTIGLDGIIPGPLLAVQGLVGCTNVTCTRNDGRCVGYHCPRCLKPTDSQGSPGHVCAGDRQ